MIIPAVIIKEIDKYHMSIWKKLTWFLNWGKAKHAICISRVFFVLTHLQEYIFLPHPLPGLIFFFFNPYKTLIRFYPIFLLKKAETSKHNTLQSAKSKLLSLSPSQVTFRAALFAALASTPEHLEIRSALFSKETFQVPKEAQLTTFHILFKLHKM